MTEHGTQEGSTALDAFAGFWDDSKDPKKQYEVKGEWCVVWRRGEKTEQRHHLIVEGETIYWGLGKAFRLAWDGDSTVRWHQAKDDRVKFSWTRNSEGIADTSVLTLGAGKTDRVEGGRTWRPKVKATESAVTSKVDGAGKGSGKGKGKGDGKYTAKGTEKGKGKGKGKAASYVAHKGFGGNSWWSDPWYDENWGWGSAYYGEASWDYTGGWGNRPDSDWGSWEWHSYTNAAPAGGGKGQVKGKGNGKESRGKGQGKIEGKSESKSGGGKSGGKSGGKGEGKSEGKSGGKGEGKSEGKSGGKTKPSAATASSSGTRKDQSKNKIKDKPKAKAEAAAEAVPTTDDALEPRFIEPSSHIVPATNLYSQGYQ